MTDVKAVLKSCPLLAGFPEVAFDEVAATARLKRFGAGAPIYESGSMQSALCVVASGTVRVTSVNPAGREATLIIFDAGSWFGDTVFSPGVPRVYGVTAHEDTELVELPGEKLRALMARYPESYPVALDLVSRRLWSALTAIEDDALRSVPVRIGRRLLLLVEIQGGGAHGSEPVNLKLTREQIANLMGMTRQGVHKGIKVFEEQGLLELTYGQVKIVDPAAMRAFIETLE